MGHWINLDQKRNGHEWTTLGGQWKTKNIPTLNNQVNTIPCNHLGLCALKASVQWLNVDQYRQWPAQSALDQHPDQYLVNTQSTLDRIE